MLRTMPHVPESDGPRAREILGSYESLCAITGRMRLAARNEDWDGLIALEGQCASIFSRLLSIEDGAARSDAYQRRKAELILRVLEDDAEIRERTNAQLAGLWRMADGAGSVRRLQTTYRAEER